MTPPFTAAICMECARTLDASNVDPTKRLRVVRALDAREIEIENEARRRVDAGALDAAQIVPALREGVCDRCGCRVDA